VRSIGRTLIRWKRQIAAWHRAHLTNAPTEAANNLIKLIMRVAFGLRQFRNHRIRVLLYAGRPKLGPTRDDQTLPKSEEPPIEWLGLMADALSAQSAIDRLQSAAYGLVLDGDSYRHRQKPTVCDTNQDPERPKRRRRT